MDFSSCVEMQKVSQEAHEFYAQILFDETPMFVSDEATIWDISTASADDLLDRCKKYYGLVLCVDDLRQPLWKLLRQLNQRRSVIAPHG